MEEKNAVIKDTFLGIEDHGILTAFIHLEYDCGEQGFGGYALDSDYPGPYCAIFIRKTLETVGVLSWDDLIGKTIRVRATHSKIHEIGHIIQDKWFNPKEVFESLEAGAKA